MTTATPVRYFHSRSAAAKHWAEPYHVHERPGGYLHTDTEARYAELPSWVMAGEHAIGAGELARSIDRLFDSARGRSLHGWSALADILGARMILRTETGARGGRRWYLVPEAEATDEITRRHALNTRQMTVTEDEPW